MYRYVAILLVLSVLPVQVLAAAPFRFPVLCALESTCFITATPDLNPAKTKAQDWACGPQTKEGGQTLDISLANIAQLKTNVPVIAAANGKVVEVQNTYPDLVRLNNEPLPASIPPCGNGVVIEHTGNWVTRVCHLKKGSVQVQKGDRIKAGDVLGAVGISGGTRWPRVSFSAQRNNMMFDPISGKTSLRGCGGTPTPLFYDATILKYLPAAVAGMGISPMLLGDVDVRTGTAPNTPVIHHKNAQIVVWALALGLRAGDKVEISLTHQTTTLAKHVLNIDRFVEHAPIILTADRPRAGFAKGAYTTRFEIKRKIGLKPYATLREISFAVK